MCVVESAGPCGFRYILQQGVFWNGCNRERRWRSLCVRAISIHALHVFTVRNLFVANEFQVVTPYWQQIEMPCGCSVELPMMFTYRSRELRDHEFGWWVVPYTEFAAKTAEILLFEVYDSYRLWCISSDLIRNIRKLDLIRVLGSCANGEECERSLRVIKSTNFTTLPKR